MAATTKSICKRLDGDNYRTLAQYCPAEAKAWRVAARNKECEGRSYTAHEDLSKCKSGDAGDQNSSDDSSSKSASDNAKTGTSNPADAVLEGAKKLKGLFGF